MATKITSGSLAGLTQKQIEGRAALDASVGKTDSIYQKELDKQKNKSAMIKAGVFENKSTGKYYNAQGQEIAWNGQTANPVTSEIYKQKVASGEYKPANGTARVDTAKIGNNGEVTLTGGGLVTSSQGTVSTTDQGQVVSGAPPQETLFGEVTKKPESIDEVVQKTYEEQAQEQFYGEFKNMYDNAQKYGITLPFKTFNEYMDWKNNSSQAEKDYLIGQQDIARRMEESQTGAAKNQMEAAAEGIKATMAQSREGVISSTKPMAVSAFTQEMNRQINQMQLQRQSAEMQRQEALRQLKVAQETKDVNLAQAIQGQISAIESQLRQIDIEAMNAATASTEMALKQMEVLGSEKRANMNAYTNLIDQGIELEPTAISGFAKQLGIPFDTAYAYYQGAQSIRDNKTLDTQTKQLELDKLNQDFQDQITGYATEEAKKIRDYTTLLQSGKYDSTELASLMGIPNEKNPVYQAQLKLEQANAAIKQYEADNLGKAPAYGTPEYYENEINKLTVEQMRAELNEYMGGGEGIIIPSDIDIDSVSTGAGENAILSYNAIYKGSSANAEGVDFAASVGTPINSNMYGEVIGVIKDKTPKAGDSGWGNQIKIKDANGNIFQFSHLNSVNVNVGQMVSPGMLIGEVGNTGRVMGGSGESLSQAQIDAGRGAHLDYTVYDANGNKMSLKEAYQYATGTPQDLNIDTTGIDQYTPSQIIEYQNFLNDSKYPSSLTTEGQKAQFTQEFNNFINYIKSPDAPLKDIMDFSIGGGDLTQSQTETIQKYSLSADQLQDLNELIMDADTGPILGILRSANPYDVKAKEIKAKITSLVPQLARGIYGEVGVLTDADVERYIQTLPNLKSTDEQKQALLDMTDKMLKRGLTSVLRNYAASGKDVSGYQYLVSDLLEEESAEPINPFGGMFEDEDILSSFETNESATSGSSLLSQF